MLDMELQRRIRERKTPLALTLAPDPARLSEKILKNFTDMFGDTPMAQAEALRYHGTTLLDAAEGRLPAVVIQGGAYLSRGMMGADVLANLISAATPGAVCDPGHGGGGARLLGGIRRGRRHRVALRRQRLSGSGRHAAYRGGAHRRAGADAGGGRPGAVAVRGGADGAAGRGAVGVHGYSLDVRDVRRVCPNAFLLLPDCDGENALPAFDDMGHGALLTDSRLQYESDPAAAIERAVKELKQWVTVV